MYSAKVIEKVDNGKGYWNSLRIGVFENDIQIGEYIRNYHTFYDTFYPFKQNGKWYALYSKDYTSTRIMELPSCKDIGGEERNSWGFCPTGYYVPAFSISEHSYQTKDGTMKPFLCKEYDNERDTDTKVFDRFENFGFIQGCVWGDDSSWKLQFLDLSKASEGIITREERWGYLELPANLSLKESVRIDDDIDHEDDQPHWIQITHTSCKSFSGK